MAIGANKAKGTAASPRNVESGIEPAGFGGAFATHGGERICTRSHCTLAPNLMIGTAKLGI
jgi:hypothetical protein